MTSLWVVVPAVGYLAAGTVFMILFWVGTVYAGVKDGWADVVYDLRWIFGGKASAWVAFLAASFASLMAWPWIAWHSMRYRRHVETAADRVQRICEEERVWRD